MRSFSNAQTPCDAPALSSAAVRGYHERMSGDPHAPADGWSRIFFWIGWWVLVGATALLALNHLVGTFAFASSDDEQMMFIAFAALQVLSVIVLLIPYRRLEWWAWWATWIPIAALAATGPVFLSSIGGVYLGISAILAVAQLVTVARFTKSRQPSS